MNEFHKSAMSVKGISLFAVEFSAFTKMKSARPDSAQCFASLASVSEETLKPQNLPAKPLLNLSEKPLRAGVKAFLLSSSEPNAAVSLSVSFKSRASAEGTPAKILLTASKSKSELSFLPKK